MSSPLSSTSKPSPSPRARVLIDEFENVDPRSVTRTPAASRGVSSLSTPASAAVPLATPGTGAVQRYEMDRLKRRQVELENSLQAKKIEADILSDRNKLLESSLHNAQGKLQRTRETLVRRDEALKEASAETLRLEGRVADLEARLASLSRSEAQLKGRLADRDELLAELRKQQRTPDRNLEVELRTLRSELVTVKRQWEESRVEVTRVREALSLQREENATIKGQLTAVQRSPDRDYAEALRLAESDKADLQRSIEQLRSQLEDERKQASLALAEREAELNASGAVQVRLHAEQTDREEQRQQLASKVQELTSLLHAHTQRIQVAENARAEAERQSGALQARVNQTTLALAEAEARVTEMLEHRARDEGARDARMQALQLESERLRTERTEWTQRERELEATLARLREQARSHADTTSRLESHVLTAEQQVREATERAAELHKTNVQWEHGNQVLHAQVADLQAELQTAQEQLRRTDAARAEAEREAQLLREFLVGEPGSRKRLLALNIPIPDRAAALPHTAPTSPRSQLARANQLDLATSALLSDDATAMGASRRGVWNELQSLRTMMESLISRDESDHDDHDTDDPSDRITSMQRTLDEIRRSLVSSRRRRSSGKSFTRLKPEDDEVSLARDSASTSPSLGPRRTATLLSDSGEEHSASVVRGSPRLRPRMSSARQLALKQLPHPEEQHHQPVVVVRHHSNDVGGSDSSADDSPISGGGILVKSTSVVDHLSDIQEHHEREMTQLHDQLSALTSALARFESASSTNDEEMLRLLRILVARLPDDIEVTIRDALGQGVDTEVVVRRVRQCVDESLLAANWDNMSQTLGRVDANVTEMRALVPAGGERRERDSWGRVAGVLIGSIAVVIIAYLLAARPCIWCHVTETTTYT